MRKCFVLCGLSVLAIGAMLSMALVRPPVRLVQARSVEIVNSNNRVVVRLDSSTKGDGRITVFDRNGTTLATIPSIGGQPTTPPPLSGTPKWKTKSSWRRLKKDMTMEQVEALLGEPDSVDAGILLVYWRYGDGGYAGLRGHVLFDADTSRVDGWSEPKFK